MKIKIFERYQQNEDIALELADQFPTDFVDEYFDDNYDIDAKEASGYGVDIWELVDDEKFVQDYIDGYVESTEISELDHLDKEEYEKFIRYNLIEKASNVKKYLDKQRKKHGFSITDSYRDIFDQLDIKKSRLIQLISDSGFESEFIEEYYTEMYRNYSAYDICEELYGERDAKENAYKYLEYYVSDSDIIQAYKDNESDEYKREFISRNIDNTIELQEKLFEINPQKNVLLLFDVIDNSTNSIGDTYEFQKMYMEVCIMDLKEEYETDNLDDIDGEIADKLKELFNSFTLDSEIEEEYDRFMWKINADKYNL